MKKLIVLLSFTLLLMILTACSGRESETMSITKQSPVTNENIDLTPAPTVTTTTTATPSPELSQLSGAEIDYTGKKLIALTFDDGPNADTTPLVLDILEKYQIVASFFLVGQNINDAIKYVMERQIKLGCEINSHSWSHSYMNEMTADKIKEEIQNTNDIISDKVGIAPKFFRPPYIATSQEMYDNISLPFICGIGCNDWDAKVTAKQRAETIINTVKDGDIILLHDSSGNVNTLYALDEIIPTLLDDDYAFVTVSKLFELKGVDPNVTGRIWTNVQP